MLSSNRIPFSQRSVLRGLRQNIGRIDNDFVRIIVNGGRNPKKRLMGTLKSTSFEAKTACVRDRPDPYVGSELRRDAPDASRWSEPNQTASP
jgi:hypothetical protein